MMHIDTQWFGDQFNVGLSSKQGNEPFLVVKGCRLVNGRNGEFVSWPAKKLDSGKYWNHCFASEAFAQAVLEKARESKPAQDTRTHAERKQPRMSDLANDEPPF